MRSITHPRCQRGKTMDGCRGKEAQNAIVHHTGIQTDTHTHISFIFLQVVGNEQKTSEWHRVWVVGNEQKKKQQQQQHNDMIHDCKT